MLVAYQGEPGAYSEDAVRAAFPDAEPLPRERVRDAFAAVEARVAGAGVVPLENSQAGSINETYESLLASGSTRIIGEVVVAVDHALLGAPGATLGGVRRVYSHPQALAQSEVFLNHLGAEVIPAHDTAGAARMVAESGQTDVAAVASVRAAEILGLTVLAERIQTELENATKFAVIGPEGAVDQLGLGPAEKTTLVLAVADRPGSLLECLRPFADRGVNLTKLESRPRRGRPFEYVFYVDLAAPAEDEAVRDALVDVGPHASMLKVLGSYRRLHG
jgi:prephenate dehydratase